MKPLLLFVTFVAAKKDKKPKPPQGCNTDALGHYAEKHLSSDNNCRPFKAYVTTSSGVELEAKNMNCYRTCPFNGKRTDYKVECKIMFRMSRKLPVGYILKNRNFGRFSVKMIFCQNV